MAENLITEIADLNEIKKNLDNVKKLWSDLISSINSMTSEKSGINELINSYNIVKKASQEKAKIDKQNQEIDIQTVKLTNELIANMDKLAEADRKIVEQRIKTIETERELAREAKNRIKQDMDLNDVLAREAKTIEELDKKNRDLQNIQKRLNLTTLEGVKANEKINAEILKNRDIIKQNTNVIDEQRRNVGNYKSAFEAFEKGSTNLRGALKLVKDELSELELKVVEGIELTEEEQRAYERLRNELGKLTNIQENISAQTRILSDDYRQMNAALETVAVGASAFGVAQGAMALFGGESEKVARSLQKLVAVQTMLTSIQKLQNSLNKDGRIMIELQILAQSKNTVVKRIATAVTKGLNTVLKSTNLLIGGGIALLGLAVVGISKYIKKSKETVDVKKQEAKQLEELEEKRRKEAEALEVAKRKQEEYQESIHETIKAHQYYLSMVSDSAIVNKANEIFNQAIQYYRLLGEEAALSVEYGQSEGEAPDWLYGDFEEEYSSQIKKYTQDMIELTNELDNLRKVIESFDKDPATGVNALMDDFMKAYDNFFEKITKTNKNVKPDIIDPLKKLIEEQSIEMTKINLQFIETQNELYNEFEAGIISYKDYLDKIEKLEKKYFEGGIEIQIEHLEQQKLLMKEGTKEFIEAEGKIAKLQNDLNKENLKAFEKWLSNLKKLQTQEITAKNIEYLNSQRAIHEEMRDGLITLEEYQEKLEQLEFEHFINSTTQQIKQLEELNETLKETDFAEYQKNLEKIAQLKLELAKASFSEVNIEEEEVEKVKTLKDYFREILGTDDIIDWRNAFLSSIHSILENLTEMYGSIFESQQQVVDNEKAQLERAYEIRKNLATQTIDDEVKRNQELARLDNERIANLQEIEKKEAQIKKRQAQLEIAIQNAQALAEAARLIAIATTTASKGGDPYTVAGRIAAALAAVMVVVGAVTSTIAKAKTIKEFFTGGQVQEGEIFSVAERGSEVGVGKKTGKTYFFDKKQIVQANEPMTIFNAFETKKMIKEKTQINNNNHYQTLGVNLSLTVDNQRINKYFKFN